MEAKVTGKLDPVTFEVLKNAFCNMVDMMAEQAFRTCYSFVLFNRDYSGCLHDKNGDSVAQGTVSAAIFVGNLHITAKAALDYFKDDLYPGDVIMFNDPWIGCTHHNDNRMLRPIFYKDELVALVQNVGHYADMGGPVPGSLNAEAKEFYAEGLRITPIKIWSKGKLRRDVAEMIAGNTRVPLNTMGDIRAMAESTKVGEVYLLSLIDKYGIDIVLEGFRETQDYVERITREKIKELPDGEWETVDYMDRDPAGPKDKMVKICTKLTIKDDEMIFDFKGSDPYIGNDQNATAAHSYTAAVASMKFFFTEAPLLNSGFFRVVKMAELPKDSVVNAPFPAATAAFCVGPYEKQMNSIFEILSQVRPGRAVACSFNLEYCQFGGWDTREGYDDRAFMWYDWLMAGWGGKNGEDGVSGAPPIFGGDMLVQEAEAQERINPLIVDNYLLLIDSGGPGKWRGGLGTSKGATLYSGKRAIISYLCDRGRCTPWGIWGGLPSNPMGLTLKHEGKEKHLGPFFSGVPVENGQSFSRPGQGGGGLGDPLEREPELVLEDVIDEWVSIERAKKDYGVAIKAIDPEIFEYEIDYEATEKQRAYIRGNRVKWLDEDPKIVAKKYFDGEIDMLDVIRKHGVVIDQIENKLLPESTKQYRDLLKRKMVPYWEKPFSGLK